MYASRHFDDILKAIPTSIAVAAYVREKEALQVYGDLVEPAMQRRKEQIELQPYIDRRLVLLTSPESEAEIVTSVNFATSIDDGEAITGAIAIHRNWAIGSDDRKARNFFAKVAPHLQVLSTLELMKYWADTTNLPADVVYTALQNVQTRARYKPHSKHLLYNWWTSYMES